MDRLQVQHRSVGGRGEFGPVIKDLGVLGSSAQDIFTVTGDVIIKIIAICKTDVASAAAGNIEVGTSADTDLCVATTVGTAVDANEIWHDATPDAAQELLSTSKDVIISNGADIILTPSALIDGGNITFYAYWTPLSTDGNVVAA